MSESSLVTVSGAFSVAETLKRLQSALQAAGMTVFATFDHADAAIKAGLELRPTTVLVFGNPTAGTKLMQLNQIAGIDLPLKILVWEDEGGATKLAYSDPSLITEKHGLGPAAAPVIAGMTKLLASLVEKASKV